ncbi:MAG: chemotaxis protein CheW [Chloroflexota bacterium]
MMTSQSQNPTNGSQQSNKGLDRPGSSESQSQAIDWQTEKPLTPEELAEIWARRAYELAEKPPTPATGQTLDVLVFWLGDERYGLPVTNVREIYPLEQLTPVPRTPDFVAGVFSARGRILSVIDLRTFFDLPAPPAVNERGKGGTNQTKIVVVANTDATLDTARLELGLLADETADVVTIFKDDLEPPLTTHTGVRAEYLQGLTAEMLAVLDLKALLSDKRLIVYEEIL